MSNRMADGLHRVNFKLHQEDFDALDDLAQSLGVPLAAAIRVAVMDLVEEIERGALKIEQTPKTPTTLRRTVVNLDEEDHRAVQNKARQYESPASFLYREAIFRLLRDVKEDAKLQARIKEANVDNKTAPAQRAKH